MAVGGPTSWSLLVRWDGSTFTDESARVLAAGEAVVITRGRGSEADDIQPGVLSATLENSDGARTPDNPLSPMYPFVTDGAWTRFAVTRGTTSTRHRGRISVGAPEMPGGQPGRAVVAVESVDMLGTIAERELLSDFEEQWINRGETAPVDLFPLTGTIIENLGSSTGTGVVIPAATGAGRVEVSNPEGIYLRGALTTTAGSSGVGPLIYLDTQIPFTSSALSMEIPFRTADRTRSGGPQKWIVTGLSRFGAILWSVRLVDNAGQTDLNVYDAAGAFAGTLYFGFAAGGAETGDDQWFRLWVTASGGNSFFVLGRIATDSTVTSLFTGTVNLADTRTVVLGGRPPAARDSGGQTLCTTATFGAVAMTNVANVFTAFLCPSLRVAAQSRFGEMNLFCDFASSQTGTRNRLVWRKAAGGRTGFDVVAELVRTTGAVVIASRGSDGTLLWRDSDLQRLPTVALTVDADLDLDGGKGFSWRKGATPSYVTATYPGGSVTYQDVTRPRRDTTIDTAAADANGARDVASFRANGSRRLRLQQLTIDLATASNDLWSAVMALEVGGRIRVNLGPAGSTLVRQYGVTYVDVYAVGWQEVYGRDMAYFVIDTVPADDPVEGVWGDAERGRWSANGSMTVTGGTCVGTTGTGTIVVTTAPGSATWTTSAAQYPLDVDWLGERITVSGPPASATSPQTLTVSARGVAPSVARVHGTGEQVDVWTGAGWTI